MHERWRKLLDEETRITSENVRELGEREKDYRSVDAPIEKTRLKAKELDTLNAYMSGIKFMEITRFMNVDHTTIWRRMQNVRKKYVKATGAVWLPFFFFPS